MPQVNLAADFVATFARARQLANFEHKREKDGQLCRRVAVILPSRQIGLQECQPSGTASAKMVQSVENILPSSSLSNVVAVALTDVRAPGAVEDVAMAVPFLGFLMGFEYIGHNVVVFEGHPSAFTQAMTETDFLLVDARMIPFLQKDWIDTAFKGMRKPEIRVYQPNGQVQKIVKKPS